MLSIIIYLSLDIVLNNFQSSYRASCITQTAVVNISDNIRCSLNNRQTKVLVQLLNIGRDFDYVNHKIIYNSIESIAVWCTYYLERYNWEVTAGKNAICLFSDWKYKNTEVPQISTLSALLFSFYIINTIAKVYVFMFLMVKLIKTKWYHSLYKYRFN